MLSVFTGMFSASYTEKCSLRASCCTSGYGWLLKLTRPAAVSIFANCDKLLTILALLALAIANKSDLNPQIVFFGNAPVFNNEYYAVRQPDGTIKFQYIRQNNASVGFSVDQPILLTGVYYHSKQISHGLMILRRRPNNIMELLFIYACRNQYTLLMS